MKTILVPLDFSPVSKLVVQQGRKLAESLRAKILFFHVVKQPLVVPDYPGMLADSAEMFAEAQSASRLGLTTICSKLEGSGLIVSWKMVVGAPGPEIIRMAHRCRPAYIVMGSHGHSSFIEFVVGSTAHTVLRDVGVPVLLVRLRRALRAGESKAKKPVRPSVATGPLPLLRRRQSPVVNNDAVLVQR